MNKLSTTKIYRDLFTNDGSGPQLNPEVIPFAASLASGAADVVASTEWVKDIAYGSMYVDAVNGDDANDGFTPGTAKKTINAAISTRFYANIYISAGTYNENISLFNRTYVFRIDGDVTLNGYLRVADCANLHVYNNDTICTFTINNIDTNVHSIQASNYSHITFMSNLVVNTSGTADRLSSILSTGNSNILVSGTTSVIHNGPYAAIFAWNKSHISFVGNVTVSSSGNPTHSLLVSIDSTLYCESNFNSNYCEAQNGVYIDAGSFAIFKKVCDTKGTASGLQVVDNSACIFGVDNYTTIKNMGTGSVVTAQRNSYIIFNIASSKTLYVESYNNTSSQGVQAGSGSLIQIFGSGGLSFRGDFSTVAVSTNLSSLQIDSSLTVSSNSVTGKRYTIYNNSQIYVDGKGVNRIPGTTAGTVKANELSFYG